MKDKLKTHGLISIQDLTRDEILFLLKQAEQIKEKGAKPLLHGALMASCFYESSTRTRLSFEAAMKRLGGDVIGFSDALNTSTSKGESLHDAMKVVGSYVDVIVLRHPADGSARLASLSTKTPIINAGDGTNQHPTQTLLDLFTIKECQGKLKELNIAFVGDLKNGRTVHSLSLACALFDMRLFFVSPEALALPEEIALALKKQGIKFSFHRTIEEVIGKADVLYMTRIQKERFDPVSYLHHKGSYVLKESMLKDVKKNLKILHPLPRVDEIESAVDHSPYAHYFDQAENGLYVRQAILALILNKNVR
jgi:aspartate carbamoyltransferase catalytic subunit